MTPFRFLVFAGLLLLTAGCNHSEKTTEENPTDFDAKSAAEQVLNDWHKAAAQADFETYFGLMTKDGVFLGTDASENWQNSAFRAYSKPHFDKGKAWTFHVIERNIYADEEQKTVWFDELLDTRMGICRGSGVLKQEENRWKVKHYVLSATIPNEKMNEVIALKKVSDSSLLATYIGF